VAFDFTQMVANAVKEFSGHIDQYAGAEVRKKVMKGFEKMPGIADPVKGALDYKTTVDRLDKLTDKATREKIMHACGCACQSVFDKGSLKQQEIRQKYATEAEFLAGLKSEDNSTVYELKGKTLVQRFTPGKSVPNMPEMRCACMLIGGLPKGTNASATVCECSRGFTKQRWETILGRPVEVEMVTTPIVNGTDECVFNIVL
jgi:hypothetical protein